MNVSGFPMLVTVECDNAGQADLTVANTQPITDVLAGNNTLDSTDVDNLLIALDGNGLINGTVDTVGQTPLAPPSALGLAAAVSLVLKGWTVTYDPIASNVIMDDGTGTFWELVVDPLGNVGTTSSAGPATAAVVLDDGVAHWEIKVDTNGLRYTDSTLAAATAAPVIDDGTGTMWTIHVDTNGEIYATS